MNGWVDCYKTNKLCGDAQCEICYGGFSKRSLIGAEVWVPESNRTKTQEDFLHD